MEPILNVRERASSFVGRLDVLEDLDRRFERGARLVTILAPGGMGKTRVAQRFAARGGARWSSPGAGGVGFCDLTGARTASDVVAIVAETFALPLKDALGAELGRALARRRRVLAVLDNCEHLVAPLRELVPDWLARAPGAQFLATSREILSVDGEELLPLGPLAAESEGVELFLSRARARAPSFDPQGEELARLARIVARLDGIPLAIELAAARALVLSLEDIERRLDAPLKLLVRAGASGKHDSMRRAIASSVDQLGEPERAFFAALSVFRGPFTLRAAEHVLAEVGPSPLTAIELLVGRSIVVASTGASGVRFTLYEAIREFATEELGQRPAIREAVIARHAAFFASCTETATELDAADLTASHAWALASDRSLVGSLALRLADALARQPERRLASLKATLDVMGSSALLAPLLAARGRAARELGRLDEAAADFERALALDPAPAVALRLAELVETQGDTARALGIAEDARARIERLGPSSERDTLAAEAAARIGHVHRREGRIADAQRETARAVALQRGLGPSEGLALALYEAAVLALFRRHHEASLQAFDEGLAVVAAGLARSPHGARLLLARGALATGRGTLLQELGRAPEAIALHAEAARVFADLGDLHREGSALYYWAGACVETGAPDDAETIFRRSLVIIEGIGVPRYEGLVCGALSTLVARRDPASAQALLARADAAAERCAREGALLSTLAIHRLHVDALLARDVDEPDPARDRALIRRAEVHASSFECDDPRFALRVLVQRFGGRAAPDGPALRVGADSAWFEGPEHGARVDLVRRAPLRRIFAALVARRQLAPADRLSLDEVVDAGWPGERMKAEAAANRVYVALATLRKLGLRGTLSSGPGGYCLDPAVRVVLDGFTPAVR
ncbi:MAG: tetratricopeptide repeat protein [Polyangiaceae bacterium]